MNNYNYPILAKPSGITLDAHRKNVISEGTLLVESIPFSIKKYKNVTNKDLLNRVILCAKYHDDGKQKSEKWQTACQKDYEAFLHWKENNPGKPFKLYAKSNDAGQNLRTAGVRHEFHSLLANKSMPLVLQAAIAAHHSKLSESNELRWQEEGFKDFWARFKRESYIERNLEETAKIHYEFAGVRGLLQLADHRASAKEDGDFVPDITPFSYCFPHNEKRGVQQLIENNWMDDLLLVRAPTGAGKTDASLLWAQKQIENNRAERLIIAMPTRFTSNALAVNVAETLSDTGLYHSSAWFNKFHNQVESGNIEKRKAEKIHEFARLLQTPITVCTIDHLLIALTLTREDHHMITFNLANSCLVIDEADFYDDFTQANILVLLEILKEWKVPVLLMSASLPETSLYDYQKIGYKVENILEDTTDSIRNRFEIKRIEKYSELAEIEELLELCIKEGCAIIYANTVDRAITFYKWFEEKGIIPLLYHSRFTEPHKQEKEQELIHALGRDAWENGSAKGIAIMTQIGEMSINISADIMISELCPIDRLTQRAGRLCRFDKSKIGNFYVLIPQKDGNDYPAPYGEYNRKEKKWVACDAYVKTRDVLNTIKYSASKLVSLLNQVFSKETKYSGRAKSNANELRNYYKYNWLINPLQKLKTDDTDTNYWRSRNIPHQDTVYVNKPESNFFQNYLSFQNWKILNSLDLPVYLIEKGKRYHMIDVETIKIRENLETIYVIREGFYNKFRGITFTEEDNFL